MQALSFDFYVDSNSERACKPLSLTNIDSERRGVGPRQRNGYGGVRVGEFL